MRLSRTAAWAALFFAAFAASAKTWEVGKTGEADGTVLRNTIHDAASGDTILVHPGKYANTSVIIDQKDLVLRSVAGPEKTILDGGGTSQILWLRSSTPSTLIEGFTLRRGTAQRWGGALALMDGASPVIRGNILRDNEAGVGAGIYMHPGCSPLIEENLFVENIAGTWGGAIYAQHSEPTIRRNTFVGNDAGRFGSAVCLFSSRGTIESNLFVDQRGISTVHLMNDKADPVLRCNAYSNDSGEPIGVSPDLPAKTEPGMRTEAPVFDDSGLYGLAAGSPYAAAGECGRLGWR